MVVLPSSTKYRSTSRARKPTDNAYVESFNGTFRAECLDVHLVHDAERGLADH